jgi:hypothetical protein
MATEKQKQYKSPGNDQIPEEPNQAGGGRACSELHKIINSKFNIIIY